MKPDIGQELPKANRRRATLLEATRDGLAYFVGALVLSPFVDLAFNGHIEPWPVLWRAVWFGMAIFGASLIFKLKKRF
jgi:hypothetical protein